MTDGVISPNHPEAPRVSVVVQYGAEPKLWHVLIQDRRRTRIKKKTTICKTNGGRNEQDAGHPIELKGCGKPGL